MAAIFHIDASARTSRSLSRDLSTTFVHPWRAFRPEDEIIHRDVGHMPPPPTTEGWIASAFTRPEERTPEQAPVLALSAVLIDEPSRADIIALGTPMYNDGMPSALKAWVDQIIRIGKTFTFDLGRGDFPLEPILSGKTPVLLSASGEFGFEPGGVREHMNHLDTHFRAIKHYFGVADMRHVAVEYQEFGGERHQATIASGHAAAKALAGELTAEMASAPVERPRAAAHA